MLWVRSIPNPVLALCYLLGAHAAAMEVCLSQHLHLRHLGHRPQRRGHHLSVVLGHHVAAALKLKRRVHHQLLTGSGAEGLRPPQVTGVLLHGEQLPTLGTTKAKRLGVVANKHGAMAGVDGGGADVALLQSHGVG